MPYPAIVANCVSWVCYSFVITDGFVLGPNAPGVVIGVFYTMITLGLTKRRDQGLMTAMMTAYACLLIVVGAVGAFRQLQPHALRMLWGFTCNFVLLTYYAAPLSTLWTVLRSRSAASINPLLALANGLNGALWTAYGIAIADLFISVPNGVGLLLSMVLIACMALFWKRDHAPPSAGPRDGAHPGAPDTQSSLKPPSPRSSDPGSEETDEERGPAREGLRPRYPIQELLIRSSAHDAALATP